MLADWERNRERAKSIVAVALFHGVLGYALIAGLGVELVERASAELKIFNVAEPPPPPKPPEPLTAPSQAESGAAAPPNLKADPTPVVAPPPVVKLPVPPPIVAAPVASTGADASAGASTLRGPGTGAGGEGKGFGSGGQGTGTGSGVAKRALLLSGELSRADYPRSLKRAGIGGRVSIKLAVAPDGRVSGCSVVGSSGHEELDVTTCRLAQQRYQFEPAKDAEGRPVPDAIVENHTWWTQPRRRWPW